MKFYGLFISLLILPVLLLGQHNAEKGITFLNTSQYDSSSHYFNQALIDCDNNCSDSLIAGIHILLGKSLQLEEKYPLALQEITQGIELYQRINNIHGEISGLITLAEFRRNQGELEEAELILEQVLAKYKGEISQRNLANLYNRYAAILNQKGGNRDKVIEHSSKVLELSIELNDKNLEASSLNELGYLYEGVDFNKATTYYQRAFEIFEIERDPRSQATVLVNLARIYHHAKLYNESLVYSTSGIALTDTTDWNVVKRDFYFFNSHSLRHLGKYKESIKQLDVYIKLFDKVKRAEWNKSLAEVEARFELKEKENEILEAIQRENEIQQKAERKTAQLNYLIVGVILLVIILLSIIVSRSRIKKLNETLNINLSQKEVLLQEVHHRVKNNMQMVASILELQSSYTKDEELKRALEEGNYRIRTLAIAHQKLYQNSDYEMINLKEYLELIAKSILSSTSCALKINIDESFLLKIEKAQALGFILNELIVNSIKYAWSSSDDTQKIEIEVRRESNIVYFTYSDNGKGYPNNFNIEELDSLGFVLIKSFTTMQLEGMLETYNNDGAVTMIQFNID